MKHGREVYEENGARFHEVENRYSITAPIISFSDIRHEQGWTPWDRMLKIQRDNDLQSDPFRDDLSLLIDTPSGPVVLLGCAHSGIVEILDQISESTGIKKFHAVIGGTHLGSAPDDYVLKAIDSVKKYDVQKIAVSHCTGFRTACRFAIEFGDKFVNASVGQVFDF
jgi:7,8-dihydropterin-6-yl-methyl-4-(beta-D-ribofuranosyl)aminobenzene 5'-phosphate synthase